MADNEFSSEYLSNLESNDRSIAEPSLLSMMEPFLNALECQ